MLFSELWSLSPSSVCILRPSPCSVNRGARPVDLTAAAAQLWNHVHIQLWRQRKLPTSLSVSPRHVCVRPQIVILEKSQSSSVECCHVAGREDAQTGEEGTGSGLVSGQFSSGCRDTRGGRNVIPGQSLQNGVSCRKNSFPQRGRCFITVNVN